MWFLLLFKKKKMVSKRVKTSISAQFTHIKALCVRVVQRLRAAKAAGWVRLTHFAITGGPCLKKEEKGRGKGVGTRERR